MDVCAGQLPGKVRSTLLVDGAMRELAEQLKNEHSLMFFARGYNYATALEAALKTKEVSRGGCIYTCAGGRVCVRTCTGCEKGGMCMAACAPYLRCAPYFRCGYPISARSIR